MVVRLAKEVDAAELARAHVASWRAAFRGILPDRTLDGLSPADFETVWAENLRKPSRVNTVIEAQGRILGWAAAGPSRDADSAPETAGELYGIYLVPEARGKGYGRALWHEAERSLSARGMTAVTLWVFRDNHRARRFYERQGFRLEEGAVKAAERFGATAPEVRYRKRLTPARPLPGRTPQREPPSRGRRGAAGAAGPGDAASNTFVPCGRVLFSRHGRQP